MHPVGGLRPANVWGQPSLEDTLRIISKFRDALPNDLPNWTRVRHGDERHPFAFPFDEKTQKFITVGDTALDNNRGCIRAYAAFKGEKYVCSVIGILGEMEMIPLRTSGEKFKLSLDDGGGRSRILTGNYRA